MVRLSALSLNSLAEILRQVNPLNKECRSILNDFGSGERRYPPCGSVDSGGGNGIQKSVG